MSLSISAKQKTSQREITNQPQVNLWNDANKAQALNQKIAFVDLSRAKRKPVPTWLETVATKAAEKYWRIYQDKYPNAFKNTSYLSKKTPIVRMITSSEELKKIYPEANPLSLSAFVNSDRPDIINIFAPVTNLSAMVQGEKLIDSHVAHELMHSLTNGMIRRSYRDISGYGFNETYPNAGKDLKQEITVPSSTNFGQVTKFTVEKLLVEGGAEFFSKRESKFTSIDSTYRVLHQLSKELVADKDIGFETYKKALVENDPVAYQKVIKAALRLKTRYDKIYDKDVRSNPIMYPIDKFRKMLSI